MKPHQKIKTAKLHGRISEETLKKAIKFNKLKKSSGEKTEQCKHIDSILEKFDSEIDADLPENK